MGLQLNIKNKVTVNAVFKTTISVVVGTSSIVGTVIFYHRHELTFAAVSLAVSAVAWLRAFTRMPLNLTLFAWCGGAVDYEEPTPHGVRRTRLSNLPDSRVGVKIVLALAAVAMAVALIPDALRVSAATVARPSSQATPTVTPRPGHEGHDSTPDQAVIQALYAAINRHDWLSVWRLWGNSPARAHSSAYNKMISGYRCTVRDRITRITSNRGVTLVRLSAQESDGAVSTVQNYRLSYVVRNGLIKTGVKLDQTGNPPPGCRK